jgi:hypothetical protein
MDPAITELKPEGTYVVHIQERITREEALKVRETLEEKAPGTTFIVIDGDLNVVELNPEATYLLKIAAPMSAKDVEALAETWRARTSIKALILAGDMEIDELDEEQLAKLPGPPE